MDFEFFREGFSRVRFVEGFTVLVYFDIQVVIYFFELVVVNFFQVQEVVSVQVCGFEQLYCNRVGGLEILFQFLLLFLFFFVWFFEGLFVWFVLGSRFEFLRVGVIFRGCYQEQGICCFGKSWICRLYSGIFSAGLGRLCFSYRVKLGRRRQGLESGLVYR